MSASITMRGRVVSLCLVVLPSLAAAVSSTTDYALSGGLSILAYNDLNNTPVAGSGAILLGQPMDFGSAGPACQGLSEGLWVPNNESFFGGLNNSLSNQIYEGLYPSRQLFWVARTGSDCASCSAMDAGGVIHSAACAERLPVLCTQSAPVSSATLVNTSTALQVAHQVARQTLTGYRDFYTWKFLGVRYAPTPLRYDYSAVLDDEGSHAALNFGAPCLQPVGQVVSGSSDDCLFLNIWTPALPPVSGAPKEGLKPVALYIYGGGLLTGDSADPNTDGTNLASRGDAVVVALNYRLGNLGFLAFNDSVHKGNYGLGDQVTALQWISRNIEYFGGDPDRVTIFGESAGAMSVHALLASPKAQGLFANAVMQSTPSGLSSYAYFVDYMSVQQSYDMFTLGVLNATGCDAANAIPCLRAYNGTALANLPIYPYTFVVDDNLLVDPELALNNTSGYTADVAVMSGINRDESAILITQYPPEGVTLEEYFAAVLEALGEPPSAVNVTALVDTGAFPVPAGLDTAADIFNWTSAFLTDGLFRCDEDALEYTAARHGPFRSLHAFLFNRTYSPAGYTSAPCSAPSTPAHPAGDPDAEYYKCHGGEQLLVFGNVVRTGLPLRDALDGPFQQLVVDYWSSFFRTRDPNPAPEALAAKGYWSTLAQTEATGPWEASNATAPGHRLLQWDGGFAPLVELEETRCTILRLPLSQFEPS